MDNYVKPSEPPLRAYGLVGKSKGLLWVQNPQYAWSNIGKPDFHIRPIRGTNLKLGGFGPGKWKIQNIDTHNGQMLSGTMQEVAPGRGLIIALPDIQLDAAYRFALQ